MGVWGCGGGVERGEGDVAVVVLRGHWSEACNALEEGVLHWLAAEGTVSFVLKN